MRGQGGKRALSSVWRCALVLIAAGACSDPGTAEPGVTPENSRLSALERDVFGPSCALSDSCHGGPRARSGLDLSAPVHAKIVDVAAVADARRVLVAPGEPDASFLFEKVAAARPARGEQMPPGVPLPPPSVARIRAWILAGAPND